MKKPLFQLIPKNKQTLDWHNNKLFLPEDYNGYYHWHQGFELLIIFKGSGNIVLNQRMTPIKNGRLFFFQPFQLHHVAPVKDVSYERATLHFDPLHTERILHVYPSMVQFFHHIQNDTFHNQFIDFSDDFSYIKRLCDTYDKTIRTCSFKERVDRENLLLIQLLSYVQHQLKNHSPTLSTRNLHYAERIMRWIEAHLGETFHLEELADELYLSKSYVSKIFRVETGSSITAYLTARRIKEACHLLQTSDLSLDAICTRIGLSNVSYFIQMFKRETNITPHQYRLEHRYR
ncbi:AraC family transcriptional regulator [Shouchella patagoniensis]|uniref:AraC family transcriptional regulator n=1 Tax=Shouchella patagoniensis TaxID=228576 RepID=UPI000994E5B1|nr:AraC family transcriptional regulator [Shouchella patagoniensis]